MYFEFPFANQKFNCFESPSFYYKKARRKNWPKAQEKKFLILVVPLIDGNSEISAHVWSDLDFFI